MNEEQKHPADSFFENAGKFIMLALLGLTTWLVVSSQSMQVMMARMETRMESKFDELERRIAELERERGEKNGRR